MTALSDYLLACAAHERRELAIAEAARQRGDTDAEKIAREVARTWAMLANQARGGR